MNTGIEKRVIVEQGLAARIAQIIEPELEAMGFGVVRVKLTPSTLQIMAEREDGKLNIEECELISKTISPVLDVEDPIPHAYRLEVSSPGIDRPLVRLRDFKAWQGHDVKIELEGLIDGRRRYRGFIRDANENFVVVAEVTSKTEEKLFEVPFEQISEARLVMNDELIAAALKGKTAEQYNQELIGDQDLQFRQKTTKPE